MSAYVVSDEVINRIVSHLSYEHYQSVTHGCCKRILAEAGYDVETHDGAEQLADAMFNLNIEAVEQRYGKGQAKEFRPLDFQYHPIIPGPAVKVFKALEEWNYQCSEGNIPATDLYKLMDRISCAICRGIVMDSKAYRIA